MGPMPPRTPSPLRPPCPSHHPTPPTPSATPPQSVYLVPMPCSRVQLDLDLVVSTTLPFRRLPCRHAAGGSAAAAGAVAWWPDPRPRRRQCHTWWPDPRNWWPAPRLLRRTCRTWWPGPSTLVAAWAFFIILQINQHVRVHPPTQHFTPSYRIHPPHVSPLPTHLPPIAYSVANLTHPHYLFYI